MKKELDELLVKKYPVMFKNRHGDMRTTAMCWGFECDDGWFQVLNSLCAQIENHVNWKRNRRANDLRLNRAVKKGRDAVIQHLCKDREPSLWHEERADEIMKIGLTNPTPVVQRVVVDQVKEKFGGLRFYYRGGDDTVRGMVRMAESWASNTCEVCGESGTIRNTGWIKTLCDKHEKERQERYRKNNDV